jgi:hypothetical protein
MLVVSAAVRAVYTAWAVLPYSDGELYDRLARGLLATGTYGSPESWAPKAPGYSFFLAGVYGVFGDHHEALYFVQHAIDLGTAVLVLAIALEWGLGRKQALVAFGIALFNPFTLFWASVVLSETISIFLFTLAAWLAIRLTSAPLWRYASFGAIMSLLALVRPAFAALAPAMLLGVLVLRRAPFKPWLRGSAVAGLAFVAIWAPWAGRNATHYHRFVPYHVGDLHPRAGYNAWCYTWVTHMLDVYGAFWSKPPVLPSYAFVSAAEREEVEAMLKKRNANDLYDPADAPIEARFADLAQERKANAPLRYWIVLPAKRATSLWFTREVTVLAQANVRMDELRDAVHHRPIALGIKLTLFALMPLLPLFILAGAVMLWRSGKKTVVLPIIGGFVMTIIIEYLMLLRPQYLVVMEPRYVVEFFPAMTPAAVVALSAVATAGMKVWQRVRKRERPVTATEQPD